MAIAISIDWDYVTGDCSHDGHCGFCPNGEKEGGVGVRGKPNRESPNWQDKLTELRSIIYPEGSPLYVAECHADIFGVLKAKIDEPLDIIDFDAHYDAYDCEDKWLCCGNWITYARRLYDVKVVSRRKWVGFDAAAHGCYDANMVFVCKSSPWTPKNLDKRFYELVNFISKQVKSAPIFIGHRAVELEKEYRKRRRL